MDPPTRAGAAAIHAPAPHPCVAAASAEDRDTKASDGRACTGARKVTPLASAGANRKSRPRTAPPTEEHKCAAAGWHWHTVPPSGGSAIDETTTPRPTRSPPRHQSHPRAPSSCEPAERALDTQRQQQQPPQGPDSSRPDRQPPTYHRVATRDPPVAPRAEVGATLDARPQEKMGRR